MGSRGGGGGNNGGGVQGIPAASRKMVQSLKEIVNGVSEAEIYTALKDCNMDPNEAVNRLLSQDPFHEVKSKREKKKEFKDTTESRPRGSSTSNRGARSGGGDRYSSRGGSTQYTSSESGGLHGKPRRENGTSSYTSSSTPTYGHAATNTNKSPPTYSGSVSYEPKPPTYTAPESPTTVSQQPYQSAWISGVPGQKSMADIVKMGRPQPQPQPQNRTYNNSVTHTEDYSSKSHETHQQHPDDDWPSIEPQTQSQTVGVQPLETHVEQSENIGQLEGDYTDEGHHEEDEEEEEEHVEDTISAPVYENDMYKNMESFEDNNEGEVEGEGDVSASSVSANMQQLNIQEERQINEPEEEIDTPPVVIPNHLQVQTADLSHLSFGSFGATMNTGFPGSFPSRQIRSKIEEPVVEPDTQSVGPSETRNAEYYGEESIMTSESRPNPGNYEVGSQTEVLKQENADVAHGNNNNNQYSFNSSTPGQQQGYTFDNTQLLNPSFPQTQTPTQMQTATPFSNVVQQQGAYTNSLPSALLAANGHLVGESDLSYSPFPISQQMAAKYGSSVSSISEALKTGVFSSSSQPTQQTPPGNTIPTGPALPQHLVHPYSQPTLPLGPFANMIGYPFMPQSYTYMPSGFQQTFAGNSSYHQQLGQLAAVLPQYKNSVSVSSLPQSAAVPSGYGSFGNSTAMPGSYQVNQPAGPAGSTLSYDDVLNAHYKENSQLLSLQQQNDNSAMWVHGAGSRTMSAVPASTYYGFQGQSQQPAGFRQAQQQQQQQQPSQTYGGAALNYPNYYQPEQNTREVVGGGGSQGQLPKPQQQQQSQQQLWQNSY